MPPPPAPTHTHKHTSSLCMVWKQWSWMWRPAKIWLMQCKVPDTLAVGEPKTVDINAAPRHIVGCVTGHAFSAGMEGSKVVEWVLTLINSGETFSHPVTAAAELNPQTAVGRDDWLRQLITTETTWVIAQTKIWSITVMKRERKWKKVLKEA